MVLPVDAQALLCDTDDPDCCEMGSLSPLTPRAVRLGSSVLVTPKTPISAVESPQCRPVNLIKTSLWHLKHLLSRI